MGIDRTQDGILGLAYLIKIASASKDILPLVKTTPTSITVNTSYLQKQAAAGTFGAVTVTVSTNREIYTKTVRKTSSMDIRQVTLEHLPAGQKVSLTVEAELSNTPTRIRFQTRNLAINGTVNDNIPKEMDGPIREMEELSLDGTSETVKDLSEHVADFQALTKGALHFRFRVDDPEQSINAGLQTLFSISDSAQSNFYSDFYVKPNSGVIGIEMRNGVSGDTVNVSSGAVDLKNRNWHTATVSVDSELQTLKLYVDGTQVLESGAKFFLNIPGADIVRIGDLSRNGGDDHLWPFKGDINLFQVYDRPLTTDEVKILHKATEKQNIELPETAMITDPINLYYGGYDNSSHYRIPSLLTTKAGTVIGAIDQRRSGSGDTGDIATVIRRSKDGGNTWGDVQTLIDLPSGRPYDSFTIDVSMVQDKITDRILLLVDMFPESTALMSGSPISEATSGYKEVNGKRHLILEGVSGTDTAGNTYTLRENGTVYRETSNGSVLTSYTVPKYHTGKLLKNGTLVGNIFLYTGTNRGELKVKKTSYLWLMSSDDDGETWSDPVDLNGQVKRDWMVFPVYHTNANGLGGSQSSAVIYSDDNGETWEIGESPNDGRDEETA